jgi:hypothetical protein
VLALCELEARYARNQVWVLLRSPGRLAIWIPYLVLALGLGTWRLTAGQGAAQPILGGDPGAFATLAGGAYLTAFGFALARHASGRIAAFRCNAEALLCVDAGVSPSALTAWLMGRKLGGALLRWTATLLLYAAAFAPPGASREALARTLVAALVAALALAALEIPAYLAGRRRIANALISLGWVICGAGAVQGLAALAELFGDTHAAPRIVAAFGFDSGAAVRGILSGQGDAFWAFLALPLVPLALLAWIGDDAIAEIYEGTLHRRGGAAARPAPARDDRRPSSTGFVPPGLAALLWKDWLALRRGGGLARAAGALFAWAAFGTVLASALAPGQDGGLAMGLIAIAIMVVALVPVMTAGGLAEDLGTPLWWLAPSSLRRRLGLWTLSRTWAGGVALSGLPLALGIAMGRPVEAALGVPAALLLWWSMNSLALALYAALPGRFDLRGPIGVVRMFAAIAYLYPPLCAFALVNMGLDDPLAAPAAAAGMLGLQGYASLWFAAQRFKRGGVALARSERAG